MATRPDTVNLKVTVTKHQNSKIPGNKIINKKNLREKIGSKYNKTI